jgi:hypothetical protein
LLFSFSVNKTTNACFCPGSNWGPCASKAHVMTVTLQKRAHTRRLLQTSPVPNVRNWQKIHSFDSSA